MAKDTLDDYTIEYEVLIQEFGDITLQANSKEEAEDKAIDMIQDMYGDTLSEYDILQVFPNGRN